MLQKKLKKWQKDSPPRLKKKKKKKQRRVSDRDQEVWELGKQGIEGVRGEFLGEGRDSGK